MPSQIRYAIKTMSSATIGLNHCRSCSGMGRTAKVSSAGDGSILPSRPWPALQGRASHIPTWNLKVSEWTAPKDDHLPPSMRQEKLESGILCDSAEASHGLQRNRQRGVCPHGCDGRVDAPCPERFCPIHSRSTPSEVASPQSRRPDRQNTLLMTASSGSSREANSRYPVCGGHRVDRASLKENVACLD